MQFQITKKALLDAGRVWKVYYGSPFGNFLEQYFPLVAYVKSKDGYDCDVYVLGNLAFSMGYRPHCNAEITQDQMRKVVEICNDFQVLWLANEISLDDLRTQFQTRFILEVLETGD